MRLPESEARARLAAHHHGVMCTLHPERGVDAVPCIYAVDTSDGEDGWVGVPVDRVKPKSSTRLQRERNLEADPRATLLVEHWDEHDWTSLWWVRAQLRVQPDPDAAVVEVLAGRLAQAYAQYRDRPFESVMVLRVVGVTGWAAADEPRVVSATREIAAPAESVFALIADPSEQPRWDGNDNLARAARGQRVHAVGDVFVMETTRGNVRENHVVEFEEGRRVAWTPAEPGGRPPGHLWRWELEPVGPSRTRVTHTYDWTRLTDPARFERARATTSERLAASLDRLAALAESS
jgi:PPOX class probable F420-dependent enzyme